MMKNSNLKNDRVFFKGTGRGHFRNWETWTDKQENENTMENSRGRHNYGHSSFY